MSAVNDVDVVTNYRRYGVHYNGITVDGINDHRIGATPCIQVVNKLIEGRISHPVVEGHVDVCLVRIPVLVEQLNADAGGRECSLYRVVQHFVEAGGIAGVKILSRALQYLSTLKTKANNERPKKYAAPLKFD